jgi:hypothetical protein
MPIKLVSKSYTDIYGNSSSNYKANAGDKITSKLTISSDIYVRSGNQNQMSYDNLDGVLKQTQGDFLELGFRKGATYYWYFVNDSNVVIGLASGVITDVYPLYMVLSGATLPNANKLSSTDSIWVLYTASTHDEINLSLNFTDIDNPTSTPDSLIDGEVSKFSYQGLTALSVGSTANLTQLGKKSGQFAITNTTIKRLADSTNVYVTGRSVRNYEVSFTTIFSGMLFESMFVGNKCLKQFAQLDFRVVSSETIKPTTISIDDECDTGWFNESYNTEIPKVLSSSSDATNLYYNATTDITATIQVKGTTTTQLEIGSVYETFDDTYNLNKAEDQSSKLFLLKTGLVGTANIGTTYTSEGTTPYSITLTNFSYVDAGGNRTFTVVLSFKPLTFGTFIEARGDSERQFYLWLKAENYNYLVFGGDLEYKYEAGVEITPLLSSVFNHSYNLDYSDLTTPIECNDINIEDDLGFVSDFILATNDVNSLVKSSIVVKNSSTNFEFVLDSIEFDISQQDVYNWINQTLTLNNNLPQSSTKKVAYLMQKPVPDAEDFTMRLYYPFLINWTYWQKLANTHPYFVSKNISNNDWFNFQVAPWSLKIKTEIVRNDKTDWFYKDLSIKDYDDSSVVSTISLFEYPAMTALNNLKEDKQILIRATHVAPSAWLTDIYGQITIEPKESSPRWVMSTEIDTNTDNANPLYGITDNKLTSSGLGSNTIVFECLLDMTKATSGNLCITSKISDDSAQGGDLFIYTTGIGVSNTNSINFITA